MDIFITKVGYPFTIQKLESIIFDFYDINVRFFKCETPSSFIGEPLSSIESYEITNILKEYPDLPTNKQLQKILL